MITSKFSSVEPISHYKQLQLQCQFSSSVDYSTSASNNSIISSKDSTTYPTFTSVWSFPFITLLIKTVTAPASYPAFISSMESPTMINSSALTPQFSAMWNKASGFGLGGWKERVKIGLNSILAGMCVLRR
ncbi:hypothetical protein WICPIJ_009675 [Wickerhamomyces pijperi]|uniref:Uncharacterized protein n=1 Tax=Wickerhamomyces pijperi TaxID=599730 RepID=A0A9P8PLT1_WICPI|nr:hypothetical protein WICPIJ_009675 [Wickerhamomyces pijperi]